jgi:CheY-like chemotaxis protein
MPGKVSIRVSWNQSKENPNAFKTFTLKNRDDVTYPSSGYMSVAVTDTGAGMSKVQLSKLFRDGVQFNVNELQAGQGSGLGLYIAKGIVEQHDGTVVASSEGLGCGTTFTMILPLFQVPDDKPKPNLARSELSDDTGRRTSRRNHSTYLRILVVDDSGTNRKLLKRLLHNHGHTVSDAENGQEAVEVMDQARNNGQPFDCILLDYEMPVMNGPDACREMRALGCDSFIVGVTGNVMAEDVALFKECGANGVLPKPFKLTELDQLWLEHGVLGSSITSDIGSQPSVTSITEVEDHHEGRQHLQRRCPNASSLET